MKLKKSIIKQMKSLLNQLPYVSTLHKLNSNSKFPAGHFYSSVVSLDDIKKRQDAIWPAHIDKNIPEIDLNENEQLILFEKLSKYFDKLSIPETFESSNRYYFRNSYFSYGDGLLLGSILRYYRPGKILEIGSGFSSALMLDINQKFLNGNTELIFIEPFPKDRLHNLLSQDDVNTARIIEQKVQDVSLREFENLQKGDILFIDSSHIVKTGSDVNHILFSILPILRPGVLIHFHDIFHPFEYPKKWILDGFGWNEIYFLRSFLMNNKDYKILLFSDYLSKYHRDKLEKTANFLKSPGSSFWIEKL